MDPEHVHALVDAGGAGANPNHRHWEHLLQHSPAVVFCCLAAPAFPITFISGAVRRMLGYAPDDFYREGFWNERVHAGDRQRVYDAIASLLETGSVSCEFRFLHAGGGWRWLRTEATCDVEGGIGSPQELIGFVSDIDELKRAEETLQHLNRTLERRVRERTEELMRADEALRRADEAQHRLADLAAQRRIELERSARINQLGELAAGLAHEINQPLAAIIYSLTGAAKRAGRGELNNAQAEDALRAAIAHAHRAAEIVTRVREFTARRRPRRGPLDIGEVIAEMIDFSRHAAATADVRLFAEVRDNLPPVLADRVQIEQVLLNLIMNGIEAVEAVGRRRRAVVVEADLAQPGRVEVCVEDSGGGAGPEARARLFEPFYTTKENGMGLGLAICQTIVEEHGGAIRAEPAAGGGLRVVFTLPAGEENA